MGLEEAQRLLGVAHQQVLGLLVVVEHHLVGLTADTGLLVATEGGVWEYCVPIVSLQTGKTSK